MLWNTQSYLFLGRELISCKLSEWCVWLFHTCGTRKRVPLSSPGHPATKNSIPFLFKDSLKRLLQTFQASMDALVHKTLVQNADSGTPNERSPPVWPKFVCDQLQLFAKMKYLASRQLWDLQPLKVPDTNSWVVPSTCFKFRNRDLCCTIDENKPRLHYISSILLSCSIYLLQIPKSGFVLHHR